MSDECPICGKPVVDGDAIYTIPDAEGRIRHYECWDKDSGPTARAELRRKLNEMQEKLREMARKLR